MCGMCEHVGVCACACVPVCTCVYACVYRNAITSLNEFLLRPCNCIPSPSNVYDNTYYVTHTQTC